MWNPKPHDSKHAAFGSNLAAAVQHVPVSSKGANVWNLIKKPWLLIRVPYMNPNILGVIGPGFLNQVPTLMRIRSLITLKTDLLQPLFKLNTAMHRLGFRVQGFRVQKLYDSAGCWPAILGANRPKSPAPKFQTVASLKYVRLRAVVGQLESTA